MITVQTNLIDVIDRIKKEWLTKDAQIEVNEDIANTLRNAISTRIHSRGEASDGSQIGTYSDSYARMRRNMEPPLQTSYVDLRVYGELQSSFVVERSGNTSYSIGFDNSEDADIAGYMEEHFGKDIWEPSTQELQQIDRILADRLNKTI